MGHDPKLLPENVRRCMPVADRRQLGAPTHAEVAEQIDVEAEKEIQRQVCDLLSVRGVVFMRPMFGKKTTILPGWPDCTFAVRGRAVAFEFKGPTGKLSAEQVKVKEQMEQEQNGWRYYIVRSVEQARFILNQLQGHGGG